MVLAVIEEVHAAIDRAMHDFDRGFFILRVSDVMPAQCERRDSTRQE